MASRVEPLNLRPDEFAFLFVSDTGVDADELGIFLRRAATVGRRNGADLRVVALAPGSLAVVVRTIGRSARAEFRKAPIGTGAAGAALVGAVVTAVVYAMSPSHGTATPLAKAGAELVENYEVSNISIVTVNQTIVVMDEHRAAAVQRLQTSRERAVDRLPAPEIRQMMMHARSGRLEGEVLLVDDVLHFRPDGYRYLVPIDRSQSDAMDGLRPSAHFRVTGDILTRNGQPDTIVIQHTEQV